MYHVIANPVAGRKKVNQTYVETLKYLKEASIEHILYETKEYEDPLQVAKQIDKAYPNGGKMIVIGGDGTINEVINGLTNLSKWEIGIIPAGSGNDIAAKQNIPIKKPLEALNLILNGETKKMDLIDVNGMKCINIAGSGIDIDVLMRFEKYTKLKGKFRYFWALLMTILTFKWHEFEISVDDGEFFKMSGFITAACNGSSYGGGIRICPESIVDDGYMDYVFAKKIKKITIPYYLIQLMKGKINRYSFYIHQLCKKIVYRSDKEFYFNVDGKIIKSNYFECKILPKGIAIYR